MQKHTSLLCGLLGFMSLHSQAYSKTIHSFSDDAWFNSMQTNMRTMHERMINNMEEMQHAFDELSQSTQADSSKAHQPHALTLDANDVQVLVDIDVPGALPDGMKAERNLDTITIEIPQEQGSTKVHVNSHIMSIEHTKETKNEKGGNSVSHSYMERTLPHVIDMTGDISIEHIQEQNTLHMSLARKHPRKAPQELPIIRK